MATATAASQEPEMPPPPGVLNTLPSRVDVAGGSPLVAAFPAAEALFLQSLGRALHTYGAAAPEIEESLQRCAEALCVEGSFSATPTALFLTIGAPEGEQRTVLLRLEPGQINSQKLSLLSELTECVVARTISARTATIEVHAISDRPRQHRPSVVVICGGVVSAAGAVLMGGSWTEAGVAAVLGLIVTLLHRWLGRRPRFFGALEPAAGFLAGAGAASAALWLQDAGLIVSPYRVSFASLLVVIPGLAFALGIRELVSRHLTAGTARLVGASATILLLCVGVQAGARCVPLPADPFAAVDYERLWLCEAAMAAMTALAIATFFNARRKDLVWILISVWIGHFGGRLGVDMLGLPLGAGVGAFLVTLYSTAVSRVRRQPSTTTLIPGLILLLPSSFGFRGFEALLHGDVTQGIEAAFTMVATAATLVAGLLIATAIRPPKGGVLL